MYNSCENPGKQEARSPTRQRAATATLAECLHKLWCHPLQGRSRACSFTGFVENVLSVSRVVLHRQLGRRFAEQMLDKADCIVLHVFPKLCRCFLDQILDIVFNRLLCSSRKAYGRCGRHLFLRHVRPHEEHSQLPESLSSSPSFMSFTHSSSLALSSLRAGN